MQSQSITPRDRSLTSPNLFTWFCPQCGSRAWSDQPAGSSLCDRCQLAARGYPPMAGGSDEAICVYCPEPVAEGFSAICDYHASICIPCTDNDHARCVHTDCRCVHPMMGGSEDFTCPHPPSRYYTWHAYDGTLCIGCTACGAVLRGGVA